MKGEPKKGIQLLVRNADSTLQVNKVAAISIVDATRLSDDIKEALPLDSFARTIRENPEEYPNFEDRYGWLLFEGLMYIPTRLREDVLRTFYNGLIQGHPRIAKMLQLMQERFFFPKIWQVVEEYIRKCTIYRRNKHDRYALYGLLQPLQVLTRLWQLVAMDFIIKLLPSADLVTKESYDRIMVVTDRFSKYRRFILYRETWTVVDLAHVFLKNVVANHRLPEQLISD